MKPSIDRDEAEKVMKAVNAHVRVVLPENCAYMIAIFRKADTAMFIADCQREHVLAMMARLPGVLDEL
jgi:hypothetical protein